MYRLHGLREIWSRRRVIWKEVGSHVLGSPRDSDTGLNHPLRSFPLTDESWARLDIESPVKTKLERVSALHVRMNLCFESFHAVINSET